jgi:hypothetical protein
MVMLVLSRIVQVRIVQVDPGFEVVIKREGGQMGKAEGLEWLDQRRR